MHILRGFNGFKRVSSVLKHLLWNKGLNKALINLQVDFRVMKFEFFFQNIVCDGNDIFQFLKKELGLSLALNASY